MIIEGCLGMGLLLLTMCVGFLLLAIVVGILVACDGFEGFCGWLVV